MILYFGCWGRVGHYLWSPEGKMMRWEDTPWGYEIDGKVQHGDINSRDQPQGICRVVHRAGWTAVGWWDRTVDDRYASNSAFVVDQTMSFEQVLALAREHFGWVLDRMNSAGIVLQERGRGDESRR